MPSRIRRSRRCPAALTGIRFSAGQFVPVQFVTVTPSGTLPTVTGPLMAPVATVIGTTLFTFESTAQAVVPSGLNPTA